MKHFGREQNYIDQERHPLLYGLASRAKWTQEDEFPAASEWADEHETWLSFVDSKGELARFIPRLISNAYLRDRALSEIGSAYFLETRCGLPILDWEPEGENGTRGEYMVGSRSGPIFVEVVTGSWQKEIKDAEGSDSPRLKLPKYLMVRPGLSVIGRSFGLLLRTSTRSSVIRGRPCSSSGTTTVFRLRNSSDRTSPCIVLATGHLQAGAISGLAPWPSSGAIFLLKKDCCTTSRSTTTRMPSTQ
jgi:hypothetical protein